VPAAAPRRRAGSSGLIVVIAVVAGGSRYGACTWRAGRCGVHVPGDIAVFFPSTPRARRARPVPVTWCGGPFGIRRLRARVVSSTLRVADDSRDANPAADRRRSRGRGRGPVVAVLPAGRGLEALVRAWGWCYNRLPIAQTAAMTERRRPPVSALQGRAPMRTERARPTHGAGSLHQRSERPGREPGPRREAGCLPITGVVWDSRSRRTPGRSGARAGGNEWDGRSCPSIRGGTAEADFRPGIDAGRGRLRRCRAFGGRRRD